MLDVRKIRLILELRESGISDSNVLSAIEKIPREKFIPDNFRNQAYENIALPISDNQTISQPFIVAKMTQLLEINSDHKVLEIGTGSGYQSAILSLLCRRVYTIERIKNLYINSEKIFSKLNITNIVSKHADGNLGWKEQIPFDRIIFTAATSKISNLIFSHITEGGIIVSPIIKNNKQTLIKYKKNNNKINEEEFDTVLFVPNLKDTQ
ncbi:MAG: Protein-L-isoaspartate O-methyltransferase [Alphaproteobacteria bacterium MarineAlpha5_Bin5]|nr:MAG: Protein-L-isoaspartate O-methyltransferase [Alphaproteobacteria bacterium MarineAlpha5_Bin5]PPR52079.1 MAG: Protein-L-isoaspartate O-methyltransferase [Alphaproteobacteria bacterium MarineAlpha5_Bin4]